jgi:hypothetical protein
MRTLRGCVVSILCLLVANVARANTPFDDLLGLKWCFQRDRPFYQEITTDTQQQMTVAGQNIAQNQKQTYYYSWKLLKHDARAGHWIVKHKIEGMKLEIDIGGNKIVYDSTRKEEEEDEENPLGAFVAALVGAEFTITLDARLHVAKIDGAKELSEKVGKANPQAAPLLKQILNDATLRNMVEQALPAIPVQPSAKEREWTRESVLDMGPIGRYRLKNVYSLAGRDAKYEKIRVVPSLTYEAPRGDDAGGLPFKIKNADLKSDGGEGIIYFDFKEGRIDRSETTTKLKGKITLDIGGQESEVELDQTQKITVKTTDTNPLKK